MNIKSIWLIILISLSAQVFALGAKDSEQEKKPINNEWILCITNFDISSLPPEKVSIASVVTREISERLSAINYRVRVSSEYAYYEEQAWTRGRAAAAKALSAKLDERSRLIFRGEPEWRYRQNLAKIDADIEKLKTALDEAEKNMPLVNNEPVFSLTRGNLDSNFPAAPASGSEYKFCSDQKIDAFLSGSITDFHGRYYLSLKLYTVFTKSIVWQDNVLFSHNDLGNALDEITRKLLIMLSGNNPAQITITTEPEDTLVLINKSFASRGSSGVLEFSPGTIVINAASIDHDSITYETEVSQGEIININLRLYPVEYTDMEIAGDREGNVYLGALYVGKAPLTLRLPVNRMEFVEFRTADSRRDTIVFQSPDTPDFSGSVMMNSELIPAKGRVERDRQHFYWTWGSAWVTGIAAWISYYTVMGINNAITYNYNTSGVMNQDFYDRNVLMSRFTTGTLVTLGVISVYGIYRLVVYLYNANKGATPVKNIRRN